MEKIYSFKEKIDKILKYRKLSINKIEKELDVDGTFRKAYNDDREPNDELVMEFRRKFQIRDSWWNSPLGDREEEIFIEKGTYVETPSNKKDPGEEQRILIKNIDRMGALNEFLLTELKRYKDRFGDL
jgi:hypothetical protein